MKIKNISKRILDLCMSVMLLFLMAYQVTGEKAHEWLGIAMFVLITAHNILNYKWYGALFKGRYSATRITGTIVNILLLVSMLTTMASGILMNNFVIPLRISGTMAAARVLHLSCSHWSFVLMGVHIGLHWGMVTAALNKKIKKNILSVILWLLAAALAIYGGYCFINEDMFSYMIFKTHFAFLDYEQDRLLVIFDRLSMMSLWIFLSCYFSKMIQHFSKQKKEKIQQGESL